MFAIALYLFTSLPQSLSMGKLSRVERHHGMDPGVAILKSKLKTIPATKIARMSALFFVFYLFFNLLLLMSAGHNIFWLAWKKKRPAHKGISWTFFGKWAQNIPASVGS